MEGIPLLNTVVTSALLRCPPHLCQSQRIQYGQATLSQLGTDFFFFLFFFLCHDGTFLSLFPLQVERSPVVCFLCGFDTLWLSDMKVKKPLKFMNAFMQQCMSQTLPRSRPRYVTQHGSVSSYILPCCTIMARATAEFWNSVALYVSIDTTKKLGTWQRKTACLPVMQTGKQGLLMAAEMRITQWFSGGNQALFLLIPADLVAADGGLNDFRKAWVCAPPTTMSFFFFYTGKQQWAFGPRESLKPWVRFNANG